MLGDFVWAFRWLAKNRLFTLAVVAILGLGIGANTAIFSMVDAVLLRPLPYQSSDRLIAIDQSVPSWNGIQDFRIKDYNLLRERRDLFEKITTYRKDMVTITNVGVPDQVFALETSAQTFSMLGTPPSMGRTLTESDDRPGEPRVAVLSDRLWQRLFHSGPSVIGRTLTVSDQPYTIVGVMPPEFDFPSTSIEMWVSLPTEADTRGLGIMAVRRAGLSLSSLQKAMEIIARQWEHENPKEKAGLRFVVSPWRDDLDHQYRTTLLLGLAAVGLVLLIACANAGGLLLSRAVQRQKEIAVRSALGAGFWRVLRQLLVESLVLAALGGAVGLVAARVTLQVLLRQLVTLPIAIPHMQRVAINGRVLLFNAVVCILLASLCSLAPAVLAAKLDLQAILRGGKGTASRRSAKLFSVLIASEAAFAVLLLVGSGLLLRSLIRLQHADKGFNPEHVLTMRVPIGTRTDPRPGGKYDTRPRQIEFYRQVLERLQRVPGVKAASLVNNLPLTGFNTSTIFQKADGSEGGVATRTIGPQ